MRKLIDATARIAATAVLACSLVPVSAIAEAASGLSDNGEAATELMDSADTTDEGLEVSTDEVADVEPESDLEDDVAEDAADAEETTDETTNETTNPDSEIVPEALETSEEELTTEASSAENNSFTIGTTKSGYIASANYWPAKEQRWNFTVYSAGILKLKMSNVRMNGTRVYICDSDGNTYVSTGGHTDRSFYSSSTSASSNDEFYLNKGSYYILIKSERGGSYTFSTSFTKLSTTIQESTKGSNNTLESATSLSFGKKYTGLLNNQDSSDYYRFTLSQQTTVSFKGTSDFQQNGVDLYLLDSYGKTLKSSENTSDGYFELSSTLSKGTYYFKVVPHYNGYDSGTYGFTAVSSSSGSTVTRVTMTRLYNKWSGEHLYTSNANEIKNLTGRGWKNEGTAWVAPSTSSTPVYRLYNPYSGDHHYTTDKDEYDKCGSRGWNKEGIAWYSADAKTGVPLYRGFNRYVTVGTHHYTTSWTEMATMKKNGWAYEGVAWYGLK